MSGCEVERHTTTSSRLSEPRCKKARRPSRRLQDAVANMRVIDAIYLSAGLEPRPAWSGAE